MPDPITQLQDALAGRYLIERELGAGGMATVYLAQDLRHHTRVAIKVLRPELAALTGGSRFAREIQITARLQHPNILPLLDSGEAGPLPFYVMPFVEGESLGVRLERETRLPMEEAVRLIAEVADGLAHAHAMGFVHRDIKPANILLSHGHAIIADFGIARALEVTGADKLTDSGMAIGTASYMSPEQASAEKLDGRSDIYSLGCVLYEALSGAPPFTGPSSQAIMARNAVDPVPSLRTVRQVVSPALEAAINKSLAKVPEDRFQTAAEFRDAIVRAVTMPATAEPAPAARAPRVRRLFLGLGAVALAGAAVATAILTRAAPLDLNRVMVFPLITPPDWPAAKSAGEDVATVIGSAMDGAGSLRWVDGWQLLQPSQRENIRLLSVKEAMAIARAQRCAFAITGRLVARGDSAEVFLELHDVGGDSVVLRPPGKTSGLAESWRGGMRAITEILPRLIPAAVPDVEAEWKARPPQAVAHFLLAESAFRRVRLATALAEFRKAIEADSTFGLAAVRGAQAASWNHQADEAAALIRTAARTRLSPRYQLFAGGFEAYLDGRADSAAAKFRAAIAQDSAMIAAWMQLGEVYMHLLPAEGRTDSLAEAAFVRARQLDSTAATQQFHLVEILARKGDREGAGRLARQFLREAADTQLAGEVELIAACDRNGMRGVDVGGAAGRRPLAVLLAAKSLAISPNTWRCALESYTALLERDTAATTEADSRRFFALFGRFGLLLAQGAPDSAVAAVEQYARRWGYGRSPYLYAGPIFEPVRGRTREVAREDSIRGGADYAGIRFPIRLWALGVWAATDGRPAVATAVAHHLAARADSGTRVDSLLARSLAAHAALAAGDSAAALRGFEAVIAAPEPADALAWNEAASLGYDRIVLGRLLLARREPARAIRVLDVLDSAQPAIFPLYLKASLELRAEAALAIGNPRLAAGFRARVAALSGG